MANSARKQPAMNQPALWHCRVHVFRLTSPGDIDAEFRAWLAEAYRVGEQRHHGSANRQSS